MVVDFADRVTDMTLARIDIELQRSRLSQGFGSWLR